METKKQRDAASFRIELGSEPPIPLTVAVDMIEQITGQRWHVRSVRNWVREGVRGCKLPSVTLGGRKWTTRSAIEWFFARQNAEGIAG